MSRMAFLTRLLTLSQLPLPSRSRAGRAPSPPRVLLHAVEGLDRHLELVPTLVGEDHELAGGPAQVQGLQALEAADAVLLVDDEVADLEVAEVGQEAARGPATAARMEVDLLRKDVAVGEDAQADLRQLEAGGEGEHPDLHRVVLAHGQAVLAQDIPQPFRAARVAEEQNGAGAGRASIPRSAASRRTSPA